MAHFCDGNGLQCCHDVNVDRIKCLKPCFGVYADVSRVKDDYERNFNSWEMVGQKYKMFKNMFGDNIPYPSDLHGIFSKETILYSLVSLIYLVSKKNVPFREGTFF